MIADSERKVFPGILAVLPLIALGVDLLTPLLIWKHVLPSAVRWGSHLALAIMILVAILRMISLDHIPRAFWLVIAVSTVWSYVAIGNGQGLVPTIWGVWLLLQFPFVALFIYLQPALPPRLPDYLRTLSLSALALQVLTQLLQYAAGTRPGDSLSGLFGENGTGNAAMFSILVCCLFFGFWVQTGRWKELALSLVLGAVSSVLGEMKLYPLAVLLLGLAAAVLYAIRHRGSLRILIPVLLIAISLFGFINLYDLLVPGADEAPLLSYFTSGASFSRYMNQIRLFYTGSSVYADIGRNAAFQIGWDSIQRDPTSLLFGYGIGARSESKSLGAAGVALTSGGLGWSVGTSLLVFEQEMGLVGLAVLFAFILWICVTMVRQIWENPSSPATYIRYAVLLFSALWPLWLYYAVTWTMRVPMLLYWAFLGYVLAESRRNLAWRAATAAAV